MSDDTPVRALLAPMLEREVDLREEAFPVDRAAVLARMASAGRVRSRWPAYVGALAAAALLLALGAAWRLERAAETVQVIVRAGSAGVGGVGPNVPRGAAIPARGELETHAGSGAQVTTSDGVAIELSSDTRVSLEGLRGHEARLDLRSGAVRCTVPHRPASHPFRVVAPEVTVLDLGTVFAVTIDDKTGVTSVSVEEGEVLIEHRNVATRVKAPDRWSSLEPTPTADVPVPSPESVAPPAPAPPSMTKREPSPPRAPPPPAPATLDDESRLLRQGLAAERQGHRAEAITLFDQLIARYPNSPLAPDAREALRRVKQNAP